MTFPNAHILVKFDPVPEVSGLTIPERYLIQSAEKDGEHDAYGITTNRRLINPQICTNVLTGDRLFVHYGAYELRKDADEGSLIPERTVLFLLDPIRPLPGKYIGEAVYSDDERTPGGIILKEGVKEGVKVKVLHSSGRFEPGTVIITQDDRQYPFKYEGKDYIMLTDEVIVGVVRDGVEPCEGHQLVEYMPDEDLKERIAENDRRSRLRDFMDKNYLHYTQSDLQPLPEPKTVKTKCVGGSMLGQELLVLHNYGCPINGQWIVNGDIILAKITSPGIEGLNPIVM